MTTNSLTILLLAFILICIILFVIIFTKIDALNQKLKDNLRIEGKKISQAFKKYNDRINKLVS